MWTKVPSTTASGSSTLSVGDAMTASVQVVVWPAPVPTFVTVQEMVG